MRIILTLGTLLIAGASMAQSSGRVIYEEKFNFEPNIQMEGADSAMMSNMEQQIMEMMANMPSQKKELLFTPDAALFHDYEERVDKQYTESGAGMEMMVVMDTPEEVYYTDLQNNKSVEQRDLMGKKFLINEDIEKSKWKLTGETQEIAGYMCTRAVMVEDSSEVVAWFTGQIPVSVGPLGSGQLPGLILSLELTEHDISYTASSVELTEVDPSSIVPPSEGKKISREKYVKLAEEKQKEMERQYGGGEGGGVFIEIDHR